MAQSIKTFTLKHYVITSVARDDMPDGGAAFWADSIRVLKSNNPEVTMEVLIPDYDATPADIQRVIDAQPEVIWDDYDAARYIPCLSRCEKANTMDAEENR